MSLFFKEYLLSDILNFSLMYLFYLIFSILLLHPIEEILESRQAVGIITIYEIQSRVNVDTTDTILSCSSSSYSLLAN